MPHKIIWLEPTGFVEHHFARTGKGDGDCHVHRYHRAERVIGRFPDVGDDAPAPAWPDDSNPDWPSKCDHCGAELNESNSNRSTGSRLIYRRTDTGAELKLHEAPIGACWNAYWFGEHFWKGPDGRCLVVKTPGGDWIIDSRASNCTMPNENEHRCWVRHGRPEDGTLHVDKNGRTCGAGAGSIMCGKYHGFLHNGALTD